DGVHVIRGAPNARRLVPRISGNADHGASKSGVLESGALRAASLIGTRCPFRTARSPKPPPRPVTPGRPRANTRSCVGVKSLMSVRGGVKRGGRLFMGQ